MQMFLEILMTVERRKFIANLHTHKSESLLQHQNILFLRHMFCPKILLSFSLFQLTVGHFILSTLFCKEYIRYQYFSNLVYTCTNTNTLGGG